jgi:hypothetical protein
MDAIGQLPRIPGGPGDYALDLIALALAAAVAAIASAFVSRAIWDLFLRRLATRWSFEVWHSATIDRAKERLAYGGSSGLPPPLLLPPPQLLPPLHLLVTSSAFNLPVRAFCAQVAARLQTVADASPELVRDFLPAAAQIPPEMNRAGLSAEPSAKAWTATLIERAVDDLQTRLASLSTQVAYGLNLLIALGLAFAAISQQSDRATIVAALITGLMAGLMGVLVQNWLARTLER